MSPGQVVERQSIASILEDVAMFILVESCAEARISSVIRMLTIMSYCTVIKTEQDFNQSPCPYPAVQR